MDLSDHFTLGVWVNPVKSYAKWFNLVTKWGLFKTNYEQRSYALNLENGKLGIWLSIDGTHVDESTVVNATGSTTLSLNKWQYTVAVFDGNFLKVYLNGILDASIFFSGTAFIGNAPLMIGIDGYGYNPINGLIDDIRIYNRALSESEIQALYNE